MGSITQEVALKEVRFFSPIGYYSEERVLGNEFFVDLSVSFPFASSDAEDLSNTVNYAELHQVLCDVMRQERKLLESAAQEILLKIQDRYDFILEARVSIRKTTPPFGCDYVYSQVSLCYKK